MKSFLIEPWKPRSTWMPMVFSEVPLPSRLVTGSWASLVIYFLFDFLPNFKVESLSFYSTKTNKSYGEPRTGIVSVSIYGRVPPENGRIKSRRRSSLKWKNSRSSMLILRKIDSCLGSATIGHLWLRWFKLLWVLGDKFWMLFSWIFNHV